MSTKNMTIRFKSVALNVIVLFGLLVVHSSWAGQAAIPNTFSTGQTLTAGALNDNFTELETEVNNNDDRININAGNITNNATAISNLQSAQSGGVIGTAIGSQVSFTTAVTNVDTLTLAAPKAGVVVFTSSGTMALRSHENGTDSRAICSLSTANNSLNFPYAALALPSVMPTFTSSVGYMVPLNLSRAISVTGPGDVTIYLNCQKTIGGGAQDGYVQWLQTHAVFVPNEF